jgi:hypothetical protein
MPTSEEVAAALERLEAHPPGSTAARGLPAGHVEGLSSDAAPTTRHEAVRRWLASVDARPGGTQAPPLSALREMFHAYAAGRGWGLDDVPQLGALLRQLGFKVPPRGSLRAPLVNRPAARRLWAMVPPGTRRTQPRAVRRPSRLRLVREAPLWWACVLANQHLARGRPLVDSMGRVWPTARRAASLLPRISHQNIEAAAAGRGASAASVLWRYMRDEEWRLVPLSHRVGQALPAFAWGAAGAACQACGCWPGQGVGVGFPGHPALESRGGGPTRPRATFLNLRQDGVFPLPPPDTLLLDHMG